MASFHAVVTKRPGVGGRNCPYYSLRRGVAATAAAILDGNDGGGGRTQSSLE